MNLAAHEHQKYADIWQIDDYRKASMGRDYAGLFGRIVNPKRGSVLDIGCGAGEGGKALGEMYGLHVVYLDHVKVADLDPFIEQPLWQPIAGVYDYGYCVDVMEHLPEEFTMLAVRNILAACERVFFVISFLPDRFGAFVGEPLHLTVRPFAWWRDRLREVGDLIDARDLLGRGVFLVENRN